MITNWRYSKRISICASMLRRSATPSTGARAGEAPPSCVMKTETRSSSKRTTISTSSISLCGTSGITVPSSTLLKRRKRLNLGQVRKVLRPWIGRPTEAQPEFPTLPVTTKDRFEVDSSFRRMEDVLHHPYLENARRLPASLLSLARFRGRIRTDGYGNAVFPHFDLEQPQLPAASVSDQTHRSGGADYRCAPTMAGPVDRCSNANSGICRLRPTLRCVASSLRCSSE